MFEFSNIFFDNKISLIQNEIFLLSQKSNFHLIKHKQRFLTKSICARILAVRNYIEFRASNDLKCLSSRDKFVLVSLLYYKKNLSTYYDFYVIKSKGTSFSFNFFTVYCTSFYYLMKFSIFPFLETNLDNFCFRFRSYKCKSDVILELNDIFLNDFNKLWYFKLEILNDVNHINKLWLIKNLPLEKFFLNFYFEQKNYMFCKSFYLIIFSYLLKGLVRIKT